MTRFKQRTILPFILLSFHHRRVIFANKTLYFYHFPPVSKKFRMTNRGITGFRASYKSHRLFHVPSQGNTDNLTFLIRDSLWFFFLFGTKFSYDFLVRLFKFSEQHQNHSSSQPFVTFTKIYKHNPFCIVLIGIPYDIAATI